MATDGDKSSSVKPCFKFFHGTICFFMFALGGVVFGYSIYLQVQNGGFPQLDTTGSDFINLLFSSAIAGIIVGAAMMVIAIIGLISFNRGCCGVIFGITYTILMIAMLALFIFIAIVSLKFANDAAGSTIKDNALETWERSVNNLEYVDATCEIQMDYKCLGFDQGDCTNCVGDEGCTDNNDSASVCPKCSVYPNGNNLQGCYQAIVNTYEDFYLPVGIVSSILAGLVFVDILTIWVL